VLDLDYTYHNQRDYWRTGIIRRETQCGRLQMSARAIGTVCYYMVKVLGVLAGVAIKSKFSSNPYRLPRG
jgi:hypothetical protein